MIPHGPISFLPEMIFHTASFCASAAIGISTVPKISASLANGHFACRNQRFPETWTLRSPASCLFLATTPTRCSCTLADAMDASSDIILDTPFFRIYSDRRIDRLVGTNTVPAGFDPATGVTSKDVVIDSDSGLYVRLYLPDTATGDSKKLPVVVYFHGGGFVTHSAASPPYHTFLSTLAAKAGVLIVSVNYRLAPEHPLPAGYEDSFRALKWAASGGSGDPWVSNHGDLGRIFLAGDSSGGNYVHNVATMAAAAASEVRIEGAVLLHAGFAGRERIDGEKPESAALTATLWGIVCPDAADGADDPRINPMAAAAAPSLRKLPCERVLVCAAELDALRARNRAYYEALAASGWGGTVEWLETKAKPHVFFLYDDGCAEAVELLDRLVAFFAGN